MLFVFRTVFVAVFPISPAEAWNSFRVIPGVLVVSFTILLLVFNLTKYLDLFFLNKYIFIRVKL